MQLTILGISNYKIEIILFIMFLINKTLTFCSIQQRTDIKSHSVSDLR
jgi:hypothetical protein